MRYRTMTADKQRAGMQALLECTLQAEKDKGHLIAQIQYSDIEREDWAKGLTREQALDLARFELKHGPWAILIPYSSVERPFLGADFTYRED
jgi:GTPase Era involved in 16S rRNA processing